MVADALIDDRGQVILVGAIVIGFLLLGSVVVFNDLVHTEELSSSGVTRSAADADRSQTEISREIQRMMIDDYDDDYQVSDETALEDNISAYLETYNELQSNTSSSMVTVTDVTVETDESEIARATGNEVGPSAGGGNDIDIDGNVYRFTYETGGSSDGVILEVDTASGVHEVDIDESGSDVVVTYDGDTCVYGTDVEIDFVRGTIDGNEESCTLAIDDISAEISTINFEGKDGIGRDSGTYDIIADDISVGSSIGHVLEAITYADVTVRYTTNDVTTTQTTRITGFHTSHER